MNKKEKIILTKLQVDKLTVYVDRKLRSEGCDRTRKWTFKWAKRNKISIDDLTDALDDNGGFCDCEVVLNIPSDYDLILEKKEKPISLENPFKIPIKFKQNDSDTVYNRVVVAKHNKSEKCYAKDDEILFPAPEHFKPKRRMRKMFHFFNGIESELPCAYGYIKEIKPITAKEFAKKLRNTGPLFLKDVTERDTDYYLSKIQKVDKDRKVLVDLAERLRDYKRQIELKIY